MIMKNSSAINIDLNIKDDCGLTVFLKVLLSDVSPSSYLGPTKGLAGNSKPTYEVCDSKSEKFTPMYCFEGTPLRYSVSA